MKSRYIPSILPWCRGRPLQLFLVVSAASCTGKSPPHGPSVILVESTRILEIDSATLGAYSSFIARTGDGRTFVNDMSNQRILEFGSDGNFLGAFGSKANGPGRFELPGAMGIVGGDSVLVVADVNRQALMLFDITSKAFLRSVPMPTQDIGQNWVTRGDTIEFALGLAHSVVGRWVWVSDSVVVGVGLLPSAIAHNTNVAIGYGRSDIAENDSGLVTLLPTDPGLRVLNHDGRELGFVAIPHIRRLGEPDDLFERSKGLKGDQRFKPRASAAGGLHRLSSGQYVLTHVDLDYIGEPPSGRFGNFRLFVSIVSSDLTRACIDSPVPLATDIPPIPIFRGDTLFVITRQVSAENKVVTMIRGFRPTAEGCDWQPLQRSPIRANSVE